MDKLLGNDYIDINIGGKNLTLAPIKISHITRLINYYKNKKLKTLFEQKKELNLSHEEFKLFYDDYSKDMKQEIGIQEIFEKVKSDIDLLFEFIFMLLSHNKGITSDFVRELSNDDLSILMSFIGESEEKIDNDVSDEKKNQ